MILVLCLALSRECLQLVLHLYRFSVKMAAVRYWVIPSHFTPTKSRRTLVLLQRASKQAFVTVQETRDDVSSKFSVYSTVVSTGFSLKIYRE